MTRVPVPLDEEERLAALYADDVLDSPAEPGFDRVARLAAAAFGGDVCACVAFVDRDRVWAKARIDIAVEQVPREGLMISETLLSPGVTWFEDVSADARFAHHATVRGEGGTRFYAGAPVRGRGGHAIGVLAVWASRVLPHDAGRASQLQDLADVVSNELELRRGRAAVQQALDERADAQKLNEKLIGQAPTALAMFDLQMNYLRVNPRFEADYHLEPGAVIGRNHYDVLPDTRRLAHLHQRALAGETVTGEAPVTRPDGSVRHSRFEITPWKDRNGVICGVVLTTIDVSDIAAARDLARRAQERLDLALNLSDTVVWERSIKERRIYASGPVGKVFETAPTYDELSADIAYGVHPDDRRAVREGWERHIQTGEPYRQEHRYAREDGEVWVHSLAEARYDADGRLERIVGVMRDITERKRFELELAAAKDAAQSASRAKSQFLANMSHELRTPLNGVMGVASALSRTRMDPQQRQMIDLIESSAQTLERLLGDILDLTRVESGRMELHDEPLDIGLLLNGVATLFHWRAHDQGVAFTCEVSDAARGVWRADPVRLRQILTNLVSNAVKFTREGEIAVRADVTASGEVVFEVRDTGVGFDEAVRARLFRRFEQADISITRRFGGAGLGLAIARGLARLMGGELDARSVPGRGSTFRLTVPLLRAAAAPVAPHVVAAIAPPSSGLQVLLAEDHAVNRAVVELILQAAASVTSVENGREALDVLASRRFDLVLMDVQMPVMDGLTAIRMLRAREAEAGARRTPVIALTANAMPEHVQASREAGADAHLSKPITAKTLLGEVWRLTRTAADEPQAITA